MSTIELPSTLRVSKKYPNMYYLVWKDGIKSKDFYNLTRAKAYLSYLPEANYKYNHRAD